MSALLSALEIGDSRGIQRGLFSLHKRITNPHERLYKFPMSAHIDLYSMPMHPWFP